MKMPLYGGGGGGVNYGYNLFSLIMERYEGKDKRFLKCEKYLDEIISIVKSGKDGQLNTNNSIIKSLCNTLSSITNVRDIKIYWRLYGEKPKTWHTSIWAKDIGYITTNYKHNGVPLLSKLPIKVYVVLTSDLINSYNLNSEELLSLILYYIGSNICISCYQSVMEEFLTIMSCGLSQVIGTMVKYGEITGYNVIDVLRRKYPDKIKKVEDKTTYNISRFFTFKSIFFIERLGTTIYNRLSRIIQNPASILSEYIEMNTASEFVAMYGYSSQLLSVIDKIENGKDIKMIAYRSKLMDQSQNITSLELWCSMVHFLSFEASGSNETVCRHLIHVLEDDLEKNEYPPESKKELQSQIKELKNIYEEINYFKTLPIEVQKSINGYVGEICTKSDPNIAMLLP